MSAEKIREEFQEWWRHREQTELRSSCAMGWAFLIWQASRAAIELELPIPKEVCGPDGSYMEYFEPEQIERCIESLGLKVKP